MSRKYLEKTVQAKEIKLIPLGDIHLGDPSCDAKLLEGTLDYIRNSDNVLVLGMGDYLNCATKNSVSDSYVSRYNPQEEYDKMLEYLMPIKDKIIGLITGNHEQRIQKESGVNVTKMLAKELGVPYLGWGVFIKLRLVYDGNSVNYIIYATHGASSASTPEGKIRAVRKLSESFMADIYLMGHMHDILVETEEKFKVDSRLKTVVRRKNYYVVTGHFLNYHDSYAEMKALKPAKKGVPKIKFFGDRWDIHVTV